MTTKDEIFVGRQKQKREFKDAFSSMVEKKRKSFFPWSKKDKKSKPYPKLFLFYGEGGLGKTAMVNECIEIAREVDDKTRIIHLDWDDFFKKRNTLPNTCRKMIKAIYSVFKDSGTEVNKYFSRYEEVAGKVEKVTEEIEELRKDYRGKAAMIAKGGSLAAEALANVKDFPVKDEIKALEPFAEETLNFIFEKGEDARLKFLQWLRDERKLSEEKLDLYENADRKMSKALVSCIKELASDRPVLFVMDTYEIVDEQDVDEWMRSVFLSDLFNSENRIAVIISGRNDHLKDYRNDIPEELLYPICFDDILLTKKNIGDFAEQYDLELEEEQIEEMEKYTQGVPVVVEHTFDLIRDGADIESVLKDLKEKAGQIIDIVRGVVDRFLKYCEDRETKEKVFHLAMLTRFDDRDLSELWDIEPGEVTEVLIELSKKHSFIQRNRMHDLVRQFLREHLINELDPEGGTAIRGTLEEFGKAATRFFGKRMDKLEEDIPLYERYSDERYRRVLLDYFNALMWWNQDELFKVLPGYILECLYFNKDTGENIVNLLYDSRRIFVSRYSKFIDSVKKGIGLTSVWKLPELEPKEEYIRMLEVLNGYSENFNEFQKIILHYLRSEVYWGQKKYKEAEECLDSVEFHSNLPEKLTDDLARAYLSTGNGYYELKQYEEAIGCYKKAVELKPDCHEAWNNMGIAYGKLKQYEETIGCCEKAVEIKPDYHEAWNNMGFAHGELKQYKEAIGCYKKALEVKPDCHEVWYNMGIAYGKLKQYEETIGCCEKAVEIKPDDHEAWYIMGVAHCALKQYKKAIGCYEEAVEVKPDYHEAWNNMGIAYGKLKQYEETIGCCEKAVEIKPDYHEAWYNMGNAHDELKQYEEVIECYEKVVEIKPDYHETWNNMGIAYGKLKQYEEIIGCCEKAVEIKPDYHDAWYNMGFAHGELEQYKEAIGCYEKVVEIKPDYHDAWYIMGVAHCELEQYKEAIGCCEEAVEVKPDYHEAWYIMGIAHSELKQYKEAIGCCEKAVEIKPDNAYAWGSLGWIYYSMGKYDESIDALKKALAIEEDEIRIRWNLAMALLHEGSIDEANREYDKAIAITDEIEDIQEAINDMNEALEKNPELEGGKEILKKLEKAKENLANQE